MNLCKNISNLFFCWYVPHILVLYIYLIKVGHKQSTFNNQTLAAKISDKIWSLKAGYFTNVCWFKWKVFKSLTHKISGSSIMRMEKTPIGDLSLVRPDSSSNEIKASYASDTCG